MIEIELEKVKEFYDYLKGESVPEGFRLTKSGRPKLTAKKAYQIIYVLQEFLRAIPDTYEQCWSCKEIFDTNESGLYWESKGRHYCSGCDYMVPDNYDRGKR